MSNKIGLQLISFNQRLQFSSKYNNYTTNIIVRVNRVFENIPISENVFST